MCLRLTTTTVTQTNTVPLTETATTTSTIVANAAATTIASNGVQYRKYSSPYREDSNDVTSTYFKTAAADFSGNLQSLSFSTPNWPSSNYFITLADGQHFYSAYAALLLQGFFIAKETGTYIFQSRSGEIDNYGYLWTGDNAYSAWNDGNANWKNAFDGGSSTVIQSS